MSQLSNLNGFDMVYALTEEAINKQFDLLFALGALPTSWTAQTQDGIYSIKADLGAPTVLLNVEDMSSRTVVFHIPLVKGQMNYSTVVKDSNGHLKVVTKDSDIGGATLIFRTNLSLADLAADYANSNKVPKEVKKQLQEFSPDMFRLQFLALNLEDANLIESSTVDFPSDGMDTNPEVIGHLKNLVRAFVESLKGSNNPYIFGYTATDHQSKRSDAEWRPTGVTYSTFSDTGHPARSTVNYLLVTGSRTVPGGNAGLFSHNWVTQDDVQGAFVFSEQLVLGKVLDSIAPLIKTTTSSFTPANQGRDLTVTVPNDQHGNTTCTVTPQIGGNTIAVAFYNTFKKRIHDKAGSHIGHISGHVSWTSTLHFSIDAKTNALHISVTNSQVKKHKKDHLNALGKFEKVLAIIADAFLGVVGALLRPFEHLQASDWAVHITDTLSPKIAGVKTRVILPAGSAVFFKDPRFDHGGALTLTTTIKD